jgi:hypothetical protein
MNPEVGIERPLPSSHETERAILGAILVESAAAGPVIGRLTVDDFDHGRTGQSSARYIRSTKLASQPTCSRSSTNCSGRKKPRRLAALSTSRN